MKTIPHLQAPSRPHRAFTLVELLVVILIIAVLVALSMIGISRFSDSANRSLSMGNLKKLQIANSSYAVDNNGRFVATYTKNEKGKTGGLWDRNSSFLDEYAGTDNLGSGNSQESRVSPSLLDPNAYRAKKFGYNTLKASYGMVAKLDYTSSGKNADSSYAMAELAEPHRTASFVTALNWLVQYGGRYYWKGEEGKVNSPAPAYRYNNKMLVAYYDGHVGELSKEDVKSIDKKGGKNNPFWNGASNGN